MPSCGIARLLVKDTTHELRNSWVVWEEDGRYPNLMIELLSDSIADIDRGLKKTLYSQRFGTHEYFWFSPETLEFEGYRLSGKLEAQRADNEQQRADKLAARLRALGIDPDFD